MYVREREKENFSMVIAHCMSTGNKTESPSPPVKKNQVTAEWNVWAKLFEIVNFRGISKFKWNRRLFSIFRNRETFLPKDKKKESDSRFLCTRTKRKLIAEYISIYKNIHICMYVCMYVRMYVHTWTNTRNAYETCERVLQRDDPAGTMRDRATFGQPERVPRVRSQ